MIDLKELQAAMDRCAFDSDVLGLSKSECASLLSMLREAEKDAARYRWLRDNCTTTQADCLGPIFVMTVRRKEHLFNVGLSIDQAMKEKGDE